MNGFRIVGEAIAAMVLALIVYGFVASALPRLEGRFLLTLLLTASLLIVLSRYPDSVARALRSDVNVRLDADLNRVVPPLVVKVIMAAIVTLVALALLTTGLKIWDVTLSDATLSIIFIGAFALWFAPDVRRWVARRGR